MRVESAFEDEFHLKYILMEEGTSRSGREERNHGSAAEVLMWRNDHGTQRQA